jgi:hypothetical protein
MQTLFCDAARCVAAPFSAWTFYSFDTSAMHQLSQEYGINIAVTLLEIFTAFPYFLTYYTVQQKALHLPHPAASIS